MPATRVLPATRGASSAASQRHSSVLSNSPAVSEKPGSKSKSANVCPVCCKAILDATKTRKGQEALECEGPCRKWIHRSGADTGGGAMGALAPPFPKVGGSTVCARAASRNYNWTIYSK